MSTLKGVGNLIKKIKEKIEDKKATGSLTKMLKNMYNNLDPDDKKTIKNRVDTVFAKARARKVSGRLNVDDIKRASTKKPQKPNIANRAMGGSMGGGMNPMGRSPDPTVQSITGYNPTMRKKGGAIKRRGGGIAKRGMGIAK